MEDGAIIHVDYDLFSGETGDLIETTREEVAKEHEMHQEGRNYAPMVCVVGSGGLIPGFEAALQDAKVGKQVEIEIPQKFLESFKDKIDNEIAFIGSFKFVNGIRVRLEKIFK